MIMKAEFQNILGHLRRADQDFGLITEGDKIAVGISGGKDSLLLLKALATYQKFGIKKFDIVAITVDCTSGNTDFKRLKKFCKDLGVKLIIEPSDIFKIVFDIRKEKNPCSLCSNLRRGILNTSAVKNNCNKVALGHHADDLIETFLLSMLYEARLNTFSPSSFLDRINVTIIRPMLYVSEQEVISYTARDTDIQNSIYINPCPVNHHTQREYMKNLVKKLNTDIPSARDRILSALINTDRYNLLPPKKKH